MLEIYEKVLGLKFVKVPADKAVVWHPDVQLFECWDAVEDKSFSGYMYLDLFPRDSKCMSCFIKKHRLFLFLQCFLCYTYYYAWLFNDNRPSCCLFPNATLLYC